MSFQNIPFVRQVRRIQKNARASNQADALPDSFFNSRVLLEYAEIAVFYISTVQQSRSGYCQTLTRSQILEPTC